MFKKLQYSLHLWIGSGGLKVLRMLLGQQGGYTKFPCFFYVYGTVEIAQNTEM